jgi:hypothetical protein
MKPWTLHEAPPDSPKKWAVRVPNMANRSGPSEGKTVLFGARGYEDFTLHHDVERRERYRARHQNDRLDDPYAPGFWSMWVLWGESPDLATAFKDAVRKAKHLLEKNMPRENGKTEPRNPRWSNITDKMLKAARAAVLQVVKGTPTLRVAPLVRDATQRTQTYNFLLSNGVYDVTGELLSSLKGKTIETLGGYLAFDIYVYKRFPPYDEELQGNVYVLLDADGEVLATSTKDGEAKETFMQVIQKAQGGASTSTDWVSALTQAALKACGLKVGSVELMMYQNREGASSIDVGEYDVDGEGWQFHTALPVTRLVKGRTVTLLVHGYDGVDECGDPAFDENLGPQTVQVSVQPTGAFTVKRKNPMELLLLNPTAPRELPLHLLPTLMNDLSIPKPWRTRFMQGLQQEWDACAQADDVELHDLPSLGVLVVQHLRENADYYRQPRSNPASVVHSAREEHLWERAKSIAAQQGHPEDFAYIMGIFTKMNAPTE